MHTLHWMIYVIVLGKKRLVIVGAAPEEYQICVNVDGSVHGWEHVRYEQSLCCTHPEH